MTTPAAREPQYALLSAGSWSRVDLDGLEVARDGRLELLRVPALSEPVDIEARRVAPSGLALDRRCGLFVSDGATGRVVRVALDCGERVALPVNGPPEGLACGAFGWLFVADPAHDRVLVYATPTLTRRDEWDGLAAPVAVACDGSGWVYVLEAGPPPRVRRFDLSGRGGTTVAAASPTAITVAHDGTLLVADADAGGVLRFARDGTSAGAPLAAGTDARALAVSGDRVYVADATRSTVLLFDLRDGRSLGAVSGFRGPVSALAADADGTVYIKTADDVSYSVAVPDGARVASGTATTRVALDAGDGGSWSRAAADADVPPGTAVRLETNEDGGGWHETSAADTFLRRPRLVRVRVTLERDEHAAPPTATPAVAELRAETEGESYLDYLPGVYARDAAPDGFLCRLLALAHAVVGDREEAIAAVPQSLDPATAPAARLPWLASWQAFEVPPADVAGDDELRGLLAALPDLYEHGGTPDGVARAVEIQTGLRPRLIEHFRWRGIWALDGIAALGLDTTLPAAPPGGLTVGSDVVGAEAPEREADWGAVLFEETAHRFTAVVPAASLDDRRRRELERALEAEKPAHTTYHLCATAPRMRVGSQAILGLDSIVAGGHDAIALDAIGRLGLDARTAAEPEDEPGVVGRRGRLGVDTPLA